MKASEIIEELPNLDAAELEAIYRRAVELHQGRTIEASPEFLAAIDEADAEFTRDGGVSIEEASQAIHSWNTK